MSSQSLFSFFFSLHTEGAVSSGGAERESETSPGAGPQRCCHEGREQERPQLSRQCTKQAHKRLRCKLKWCVCVWMDFSGTQTLTLLTLIVSWRSSLRSFLRRESQLRTTHFRSASVFRCLRRGQFSLTSSVCSNWSCPHCELCVHASLLWALTSVFRTANRVTSSLFNTLMSLPQFSVRCSLRLQHAGKACPNCLILWQSTLLNTLWKGFEKERRLFFINFCSDSLMGCWTSQPELVSLPLLSICMSLSFTLRFRSSWLCTIFMTSRPNLLPPQFPPNIE